MKVMPSIRADYTSTLLENHYFRPPPLPRHPPPLPYINAIPLPPKLKLHTHAHHTFPSLHKFTFSSLYFHCFTHKHTLTNSAMSLEALNPAPAPHRRFDDYGYDSCRRAKRSKRISDDEYLAGCLVALRSGGEASSSAADSTPTASKSSPSADRIYKCSVCGKGFQSHQALGGHKASHRSKPQAEERKAPSNSTSTDTSNYESAPGPHRLHKCSTCGRSFPSGQALGGHMRKHYGGIIGGSKSGLNSSDGGNGDGFSAVTSFSGGGAVSCSYSDGDGDVTAVARSLDLNLPSEELDLTLKL